jgi:hypothetical protein
VAVLPWNVNGPAEVSYLGGALTDMISSRVGSNEVVEIVRKDLVTKAAGNYDLKNIGGKEAVKLGRELNADFLLYGSVSVLGESISLDANILNVDSGEISPLYSSGLSVASVVKMAQTLSGDALKTIRFQGRLAKPDLSYTGKFKDVKKEADNVIKVKAVVAPGVELAKPADIMEVDSGGDAPEPVVVITRKIGEKTLKRRSSNLDGFFVSMTGADLDGDGFDEIFMISDEKLLIANFGLEGLKIIKEFSFPAQEQNISLSSGDSDRDGRDEVYLARLVRGKPASLSIEYLNGSYVVNDTGLNYFLRVIEIEGEGGELLAQGFKPESGFFRKILRIKKDGKSYTENGKFDIPKSVARSGLSNFQIIDIDKDGTNEIVTLGKRGNLTVYKADANSKFKEYFRSPESYGGSLNELQRPETVGYEYSVAYDPYYMPSEIKYGDFDSDGVEEIMVKRNVAGGLGKLAKKVMFYKSGSLHRLSWNVALFEEEWKTRDISGYIADFMIADLDGDGTNEATMIVVENLGNMFKRDKMHSYLLSYSIK